MSNQASSHQNQVIVNVKAPESKMFLLVSFGK